SSNPLSQVHCIRRREIGRVALGAGPHRVLRSFLFPRKKVLSSAFLSITHPISRKSAVERPIHSEWECMDYVGLFCVCLLSFFTLVGAFTRPQLRSMTRKWRPLCTQLFVWIGDIHQLSN